MNRFRKRIMVVRPELAERQAANAEKRALALMLVGLRWRANMTVAEISEETNLDLSDIQQLESLTGPLPSANDVERYTSACGHN